MRRKNRKSGWSLAIVGKSRNAERWWGVVGKNVQKRERERERENVDRECWWERDIARRERRGDRDEKERKKERKNGWKEKKKKGGRDSRKGKS